MKQLTQLAIPSIRAISSIMAIDDTRRRLKISALRLFAQRDIDSVSVREIQAAAGQRSGGTLAYYFRTKDAPVREILIDGAEGL